jgi:hypothetical protein
MKWYAAALLCARNSAVRADDTVEAIGTAPRRSTGVSADPPGVGGVSTSERRGPYETPTWIPSVPRTPPLAAMSASSRAPGVNAAAATAMEAMLPLSGSTAAGTEYS